ncbi:Capsule polysaccharide biosynthesis protein [compost metagenome]
MNFLILINSAPQYKYFYYAIGCALKRLGHEVCYAVDARRSCILEPLSELDHGSKTFFFDEYFKKNYELAVPSNKSDITWGEYFFSEFDRFLTHDFNLDRPAGYWEKVHHCLDGFFDGLIKDQKIDAVIYENISNSFAFSAYAAISRAGKRYLGLIASRLPGRFEVHTSVLNDELNTLNALSKDAPSADELSWYESYRAGIVHIVPDYMKYNNLDKIGISKLFSLGKIKQVCRLLVSWVRTDHFYDYQFGSPLRAIVKGLEVNLKRKISALRSVKYFEADDAVDRASESEEFYVYPMHFHPESSTSVLSPLYTNEFNNILNISNSLPLGVKLYVKDHMSAFGIQTSEFYRKVSALPAVRLVKPTQNIKKLMLKSKGLITVNSTAGLEALVLGKPVYLLGRVFYQEFPGVTKLKNFSDLPAALSVPVSDSVDIASYIVAYRRFTHEGDLRISSWRSKDNKYYDELASLLASKVAEGSSPL